MSPSRRDFFKQASMLSGGGVLGLFSESIQRAMAIEPQAGTTFLDAEHIVVLMQENRSFDHTFGSLRGVRGFDDPRAIRLADHTPVWAQKDSHGKRFLPFRLNMKDTKSTWMGDLPHSWGDQVDARNDGQYDRWLEVKRSRSPAFADMPLTMGYYTREDIPFYYELADAFTVCDQYFCSSLTGTTANRLHLWSGTIRAKQSANSKAHVLNQDVDYGRWANWPTFPERLEDVGVTWKVYQNELSLESGLQGEHDAWLSNFTDNPLEWFEQYGVRFANSHRQFIHQRLAELQQQISDRQSQAKTASEARREQLNQEIAALQRQVVRYQSEKNEFSADRYTALPTRNKRLHERAFTNNSQDADFRELTELMYQDGDQERRLLVPQGDVLHQFRQDVKNGNLPTVSWLVPSQRFSDHPSSAWFGAWYLSEVFDILTNNPEVWKKTVFILNYDENDGYFDHVPPFVAPDPARSETGRVSEGIDAGLEFVSLEQDRNWHPQQARGSSIGLGYRVPMVIASPWSRGGAVCSQVFDHTSVLQFMEKVLTHKTGKQVEEPNINRWRRAVCGDLTSAFRASDDRSTELQPLDHNQFVADIHRAKFKALPTGFHAVSDSELAELRENPQASPWLPKQESGLRPSSPLPYELHVTGKLTAARDELIIRFEAGNELFKERAAGGPFTAYAWVDRGRFICRNYAVLAGDAIEDSWQLSEFDDGKYRVDLYGPNGYFWSFRGSAEDPPIEAKIAPVKANSGSDDAEIRMQLSSTSSAISVTLHDNAYGNAAQSKQIAAGSTISLRMPTRDSHRWYDLSLSVLEASNFERRFAGRLENGTWGFSDPLIGSR